MIDIVVNKRPKHPKECPFSFKNALSEWRCILIKDKEKGILEECTKHKDGKCGFLVEEF